VISAAAAQLLLAEQAKLEAAEGKVIVRMETCARSPALLSPGLIDVTDVAKREDAEIFGPLLQVICVPTFEAAMTEANNTAYGSLPA